MKRVLMTGARGFVGQNLLQGLGGAFAVATLDLAQGDDLTVPATFDRVEGAFDAVIHLAGLSFVPDSYERPFEFYRVNINTALNVAEFCRRRGVRTLIYPNTYVYGQPQRLPVDEQHPIALPSPYHLSKKLAEDLLMSYFGEDGTRVVALRVFNLYGRHQNPKFLIPQMVAEACSSGRITVRDVEPRRDFLHIKDFVRLIRLVLEADVPQGGIYNVGFGQSHSVAEVIGLIQELLARPIELRNLNERRPNEIMDCYADVSKIKSVFGWTPRHSLRDGLRDLVETSAHV